MKPFNKVATPTLIITPTVAYKMRTLVKKCDKEVGWHGFVEKVDANTYKWYDIILFPQYVTGSTVTPDQNEYNTWLEDQATNHFESFNRMRLHGHSHVNMGVTPSAVDLTFRNDLMLQMNEDVENPFYIFLIINKSDKVSIELYDFEKGVIFDTDDVLIVWEEPDFINNICIWTERVQKEFVKENKLVCSTTQKASNSSTLKNAAKQRSTLSDAELWAQRYPSYYYGSGFED